MKNFAYALVDGEVYFRENSVMMPIELNGTAKGRITGMIGLRQIVNELIQYQLEDYPEADIEAKQGNRNKQVQIFQYVIEGTFDAYLYQTLENKQKFISQDGLTLDVGIHHHNDSGIIIQFPDNDREGVQPRRSRRVVPPVAGDDLVPAILFQFAMVFFLTASGKSFIPMIDIMCQRENTYVDNLDV